ncbi:MAG: sugar MFS transporter [Bacteroidetes bacterium]|nr:MAG: sugar MFS transporter [Bacteroidota bacterium]
MALAPSANLKNTVSQNGKKYTLALIVVVALFTIWGILGALNDILTNHLKKAFVLEEWQATLVQFAFFMGYFLAAIPAGKLMEKLGYRKGILIGLSLCLLGCVLFIPAAEIRVYGLFLGALLVLAFGCTFLEVAANPYVSVLGDPKFASSRLNLAQGFNALSKMLAAKIGGDIILGGKEISMEQIKLMSSEQFQIFQEEAALSIKGPYFFLIALLFIFLIAVYFTHLPEIQTENELNSNEKPNALKYQHLVLGIIGIFLYVGAQEAIAGKVLSYIEYLNIEGIGVNDRTTLLTIFLGLFMAGRYVGAVLQTKIDASLLLFIYAVCSLILCTCCIFLTEYSALYSLIAIGFFNSIQFPTIFTLALKNLGISTKQGSTYLVMAICGAAIIPMIMAYIIDLSDIKIICYIYVIFYALKGSKVKA